MIRLRAPAKLNLYLRVIGRRPDGYHELETVFERVDLSDELTFEAHPTEVSLICSDPALSCGEDNLILKAARLLQVQSQTQFGARISLAKQIPIAAGLGGGSSDAATTLQGLNELWGLRWPRTRLVELAVRLGSDVPFFFTEPPLAVGRGRGERCEPADMMWPLAHVLAIPDAKLSTKAIYEGAQFDLTASKPSIRMVLHALSNGSPSELAPGLWNDLEPEAIRRCPVISLIQSCLREHGCLAARVSGSGPSVFGLCRDLAHAQDVTQRLRQCSEARPWRIELIQTDHRPSFVATPFVS